MNRNSSSAKTLRRVLGELEGQKHLVVLSFLLALASVAGTLFVPILVVGQSTRLSDRGRSISARSGESACRLLRRRRLWR